ncbi:hypothetical protein VB636_03265 [Paracoccus sp. APAP_BH8]
MAKDQKKQPRPKAETPKGFRDYFGADHGGGAHRGPAERAEIHRLGPDAKGIGNAEADPALHQRAGDGGLLGDMGRVMRRIGAQDAAQLVHDGRDDGGAGDAGGVKAETVGRKARATGNAPQQVARHGQNERVMAMARWR